MTKNWAWRCSLAKMKTKMKTKRVTWCERLRMKTMMRKRGRKVCTKIVCAKVVCTIFVCTKS